MKEMPGKMNDLKGCAIIRLAVDRWALVRVRQGKVFITHKNAICTPANILLECGGKACRRRPEEGTK